VRYLRTGAGTPVILLHPLRGHDPRKLPDGLVADLYGCGSLTGHAQAFRSLCPQWKSWICARDEYTSITMPVTLPTDNYPTIVRTKRAK
jgi:hypothetical protein